MCSGIWAFRLGWIGVDTGIVGLHFSEKDDGDEGAWHRHCEWDGMWRVYE